MYKALGGLLLMASLTVSSNATTNALKNTSQSAKTGVLALLPESGFNSQDITVEKVAIPFTTYDEWLTKVKQRTQSEKAVEKFKQAFPEETTARLLQNTKSHWISYQSDGLKISGAMVYPSNWHGEQLPVVIYNRGGNYVPKHNLSLPLLIRKLLPIAEQGYLVLASNYRGSKFSEGKDEFGGADVNDVLRLIEIAKTIPNANADKIALFGWSRGGMMTWQTMRENKTDIDAVILGAGVVDQLPLVKRRPEMEKLMQHMIPDFEKNREPELAKRSAINWMHELNPDVPILLLHGDKDWRVDVSQSQRAAERLKELNHPHELVVYPDGDHGLFKHQEDVQQRIISFLKEHLY